MTKWQAIILRFGSCIFVFFGSLGAQTAFIRTYHLYGHALVLGIFIYMMLVDVLPILTGDHEHNHGVATESGDNASFEDCEGCAAKAGLSIDMSGHSEDVGKAPRHNHETHTGKHLSNKKKKGILFLIFIISFGAVAASIVLSPSTHDCSDHQHGGDCNHDHGVVIPANVTANGTLPIPPAPKAAPCDHGHGHAHGGHGHGVHSHGGGGGGGVCNHGH